MHRETGGGGCRGGKWPGDGYLVFEESGGRAGLPAGGHTPRILEAATVCQTLPSSRPTGNALSIRATCHLLFDCWGHAGRIIYR